jgi:AcrR family transcriptional regulator
MSAPARLTAKQVQGARSREEILDAAERHMGARGYAATSISTLATASGLPTSSIYWHFGSKAGVLEAVMERGSTRFFGAAAPTGPDERTEPRQRLHHLVERIAESMGAHPQFLRLFVVLMLGAGGEPAQREVVMRVRERSHRLLGAGLARVYAPWGDEVADRVGQQVITLTQALLDGLFLAAEAGRETTAALVEQAVTAVHAVAEAARDAG